MFSQGQGGPTPSQEPPAFLRALMALSHSSMALIQSFLPVVPTSGGSYSGAPGEMQKKILLHPSVSEVAN